MTPNITHRVKVTFGVKMTNSGLRGYKTSYLNTRAGERSDAAGRSSEHRQVPRVALRREQAHLLHGDGARRGPLARRGHANAMGEVLPSEAARGCDLDL